VQAVNYSLRFVPSIVRLKEALSDGYVGADGAAFIDVRLQSESLVGADNDASFSWVCDHHNGGGVLNIFGSHIVDLLVRVKILRFLWLRYPMRCLSVFNAIIFNFFRREIGEKIVVLCLKKIMPKRLSVTKIVENNRQK
jgi:hypothetical protein